MSINRADLISALASEFTGDDNLKIETSNFISDTGAMDCTAMGLSIETLQKTKNVIEQHEAKFSKETSDPMNMQYLLHLRVAKKCIEEVIAQKLKG